MNLPTKDKEKIASVLFILSIIITLIVLVDHLTFKTRSHKITDGDMFELEEKIYKCRVIKDEF